jgi:hypothetical protein
MPYCRKTVVAGMSSHPRCAPPAVDIADSSALVKFPPSTIPFRIVHVRITAQIPYTAGGPHGDEIRPD